MTSGFASAKKSRIRGSCKPRLMFQFRIRMELGGQSAQRQVAKSPVSISCIEVTASGTLGSCTPMVANLRPIDPLLLNYARRTRRGGTRGPRKSSRGIQRDGPDKVRSDGAEHERHTDDVKERKEEKCIGEEAAPDNELS